MGEAQLTCSSHLHVGRQLVHITKDGDTCIGQTGPARHLHHQATARVLNQVAGMDCQWAEAENGQATTIRGKVYQCAKGVPCTAVTHNQQQRVPWVPAVLQENIRLISFAAHALHCLF